MTTDEVIDAILLTVSKHKGDKLELYDRLSDIGEEWVDKHNLIVDIINEDEEGDEGDEGDDDDEEPDSTIEYEEDK